MSDNLPATPNPEDVAVPDSVTDPICDLFPWMTGGDAERLVQSLAAAGFRVLPAPQPALRECPNCGSGDPSKVGIRPATPLTGTGAYSVAFTEVCSDPWHAAAPSPDEDTRREPCQFCNDEGIVRSVVTGPADEDTRREVEAAYERGYLACAEEMLAVADATRAAYRKGAER